MKPQDQNTEKHINGIVCDVTNCHYNHQNKMCTASQIKVGPSHADCTDDTICVTFKPE